MFAIFAPLSQSGLLPVVIFGTTRPPGACISNFSVDKSFYTQPNIIFKTLFENSGNIYLNPYGLLKIENIIGSKVDEIKIDPYFVMPMHYNVQGLTLSQAEKMEPVETYLKESGLPVENLPKFTIKKEDILEDQNTKVIVLEKKQ